MYIRILTVMLNVFESVLLNVHLDISGGVYFLSIVALVFCFL